MGTEIEDAVIDMEIAQSEYPVMAAGFRVTEKSERLYEVISGLNGKTGISLEEAMTVKPASEALRILCDAVKACQETREFMVFALEAIGCGLSRGLI